MNYALLIYGDEKVWEAADEAARKEVYAAHTEFARLLRRARPQDHRWRRAPPHRVGEDGPSHRRLGWRHRWAVRRDRRAARRLVPDRYRRPR